MIDTSSVEALVRSCPAIPQEIDWLLLLERQSASSLSSATKKLAHRGFLGCVPVAHERNNVVVLRVMPARDLGDCPVVDTWQTTGEALTIAPKISYLIAGRLAELDTADPEKPTTAEQSRLLIELSEEFGDRACCERLLARLPEAAGQKAGQERSSVLWEAIDARLPWCQVMAGAWSHDMQNMEPWLTETLLRYPDEPIVQRIYVCHNVLYKTGVDLTAVAWKVIAGDCVFDANYTGFIPGPSSGQWKSNALASSVRWLKARGATPPSETVEDLWPAAQAYAGDVDAYDGRLHLAAAQRIARRDPFTAYLQICNAAAFEARVRGRVGEPAIERAQSLVEEHGWPHLRDVLSMSRRMGG